MINSAPNKFWLPSLSTYVARLYFFRFLGLLVAICVILQMLDLLAKSDEILAGQGETYIATFRYVALRFPQLVSKFLPFTALLAALLTLATLNTSSEIVVMKAAGLSPYRVLSPMILVSLGIAIAHFAFNESVLVRTTAILDDWDSHKYAANLPPPPESSQEVWITDGNKLIWIEKISRQGNILVMDNVTQYDRDENARLTDVEKADFAIFKNNRWTMFDVRHFNVAAQETTALPTKEWHTTIPPDRFLALSVKPEHVSIYKLYKAIQQLNPTGHPASVLLSSFFRKISQPASTIIMPMLAALAGFGVHRSGMLFVRVISGMAIGFGFFVVDNMIAALGQFGKLPPFLAAWGAFMLFTLFGWMMILYTEE
jgi:lipopolysaccharide export system permease protein